MEDELLKLRFKAGSVDTLQRIYEKYRNFLATLAMTLLNDATMAEDVVHDIFVSLAQSSAKLQLHDNLRGYLATCVVNTLRGHVSEGWSRTSKRTATLVRTT